MEQHPRSEVSNDEILAHEKSIRDEVARSQPLISEMAITDVLRKEFNGDPVRLAKVDQLLHPRIRFVRGDGDCLYRAIALAYLSQCNLDTFKKQATGHYKDAGFEHFAFDCFLEDIPTDTSEAGIINAWTESLYNANSAVMVFRLLASAYLRLHKDEYEVYLEEGGYEDLCRTTECLGQDADHLAINALAMALNVHLEIAYLDGTPGDLNYHHFNEEGTPKISLLYRPGHYDVLVH